MRFPFPKDFLFGAACSACQIESGCNEGGKGEDVGEHFSGSTPKNTAEPTLTALRIFTIGIPKTFK
jgi:beta-glucosidase/6-phospho-beta-glucosidase/beta-galactosidase